MEKLAKRIIARVLAAAIVCAVGFWLVKSTLQLLGMN